MKDDDPKVLLVGCCSREEFLRAVLSQEFAWVYMPPPRLVLEQKNGLIFAKEPGSEAWARIRPLFFA